MKLHQKGIGAVEVLLVSLIVAILGGTGYYVYHANKTSNDTLNSAAKDASGNPKFSAKKSSSTSNQQYLTIKEWGVKIPLSTADAGAYYKLDSNTQQSSADPTNLTVYASEVDNLVGPTGTSCKGEYVAYLLRLPTNDSKWQPSKTEDDGNVSPLFGERTDIGNYRYAIATKKSYGPACWETSKTGGYNPDPTTSEQFAKVVGTFASDFKNITAAN